MTLVMKAFYNKTCPVLERMSMMQAWADYLESLKEGGNRVSMYGAIRIKKNANEGA
jgi:hypothetical protein